MSPKLSFWFLTPCGRKSESIFSKQFKIKPMQHAHARDGDCAAARCTGSGAEPCVLKLSKSSCEVGVTN